MTADPAAPNAEAVYLYREEINDDKLHMQSVYVRLKILRDEGKRYGDVEIVSGSAYSGITDIQGRTIHSDGTSIPFTGKPYEKLLVKTATVKYKAKVFSLPDVETGSILEYRYKLRYDDTVLISPDWELQQPFYVHKAHYHFVPTQRDVISHTDNGNVTSSLAYSQRLPEGAKVVENCGTYDLNVANLPAIPVELDAPPMHAFGYRVRFYYTSLHSAQQFWNSYGKVWSRSINKFAAPSAAITQAAHELTSTGSTDDQKLSKLYDAVMQLDNTSFSREHSKEENRTEGVKRVKSASDVWSLKRGSSDDLSLLFLSLARAAGFRAYAMAVVDRDRDIFQENYLNENQFDDLLVIVVVDGKEHTFDPGERYTSYGQLHWNHYMVGGLRQTDGPTALATTLAGRYQETVVQRSANLILAPDGAVTGSATLVYTGAYAVRWRQKALRGDQVSLKKELDDELQAELPPGAIIHTDHFLGLDTPDTNLVIRLNVTGNLGTGTGKRVFLPLALFSSGSRDPFSSSHREEPIDLRFPYIVEDQVTIRLPDDMQVESLPEAAKVNLPDMAVYVASTKNTGQTLTYARTMAMANILYAPTEYAKLKSFLDGVSSKDREQAVLQLTAAPTGQ